MTLEQRIRENVRRGTAGMGIEYLKLIKERSSKMAASHLKEGRHFFNVGLATTGINELSYLMNEAYKRYGGDVANPEGMFNQVMNTVDTYLYLPWVVPVGILIGVLSLAVGFYEKRIGMKAGYVTEELNEIIRSKE